MKKACGCVKSLCGCTIKVRVCGSAGREELYQVFAGKVLRSGQSLSIIINDPKGSFALWEVCISSFLRLLG